MAMMYVIGEYRADGQLRVGVVEREWVSKEGIECVCLKIIDHHDEHKDVYRTYHKSALRVDRELTYTP
jgi:uncharacterized radical SAM superfamily protein